MTKQLLGIALASLVGHFFVYFFELSLLRKQPIGNAKEYTIKLCLVHVWSKLDFQNSAALPLTCEITE